MPGQTLHMGQLAILAQGDNALNNEFQLPTFYGREISYKGCNLGLLLGRRLLAAVVSAGCWRPPLR